MDNLKTTPVLQNSFRTGFWDGMPIGLGYFSVSVTFGMMAIINGLPIWAAVAISATNVTSAGQVAGLSLMCGNGSLFEMALTQLIINLRYALMSISVSQKLHQSVGLADRLLCSFMITDEIFVVASARPEELGKRYLAGIRVAPYLGWTLGTLVGAAASSFLPETVRSALGIALYGMFIAIVLPVARKHRNVLCVVLFAVLCSVCMQYLPVLNQISSGFSIIICTILAASAGAYFAPIQTAEDAS